MDRNHEPEQESSRRQTFRFVKPGGHFANGSEMGAILVEISYASILRKSLIFCRNFRVAFKESWARIYLQNGEALASTCYIFGVWRRTPRTFLHLSTTQPSHHPC